MMRKFLHNNKEDFERGLLIFSSVFIRAKNKIVLFFGTIQYKLQNKEMDGRLRIERAKKALEEIKQSRKIK